MVRAWSAIELLDGADQAQVAFLDEVQERQPTAGVALGDRDDQTQVRLQQVVLGGPALDHHGVQVGAVLRVERHPQLVGGRQALLGEQARLDALGEVDLLLRVEQLGLADAVEVGAHQVGRDAPLVLAGGRHLVEVHLRHVDDGFRVQEGSGRPGHVAGDHGVALGDLDPGGASLASRGSHLAPPWLVVTHGDQIPGRRVKSR
jgi:hypothetical protein